MSGHHLHMFDRGKINLAHIVRPLAFGVCIIPPNELFKHPLTPDLTLLHRRFLKTIDYL